MKNNIGILSYGLYIPKKTMSAKEISDATNGFWTKEAVVDKLGINKIHIAGNNEGTQEMGYLAAQNAIENAKIDPKEIDVILCIGEEYKEYPLTTSALYIQDKVGATNAWGIDIANRCCTTCSTIKIAKDMLIADDEIDTILIAGGYRNNDMVDFTNKDMSMMYNLSAGGGALILKKGMDKNLVLGSHIIGDGSMSRDAGVEIGGISNPITKENLDESFKSLRLLNATHMKNRLNEVSMTNWYKCIDESLRKSGNLKRDDIDYMAILHFKRSQHEYMIKDLGLQEENTTYLEDYGHIGQIDQILSLALGVESGKIKDGSLVNMLAAGIGYVWASTNIRWGK